MSTAKRERSLNFSKEEIELLTTLVAQHKNILENKKSDAVTWQEKDKCWKTIESLFNCTSGVNFRNAKTLKAKYECLKRVTRKKSALIRAETYRTGGGPSTSVPLTPIEEKVKDMILLSVEGSKSRFDSDLFESGQLLPSSQESLHFETIDLQNEIIIEDDHITITADEDPAKHQIIDNQPTEREESHSVQTPMTIISECATQEETGTCIGNNEKWTNWKPKSLRSKKHPALSVMKKRPFERVADSKLEIADLQKKILEEELINKRKQWAFEEEEREFKKRLWALQEKYWENMLKK